MNWSMIGHEWAVELLKSHVASHTMRHAYLLTGAQGVGRRTLALAFAQAVNCLQPSAPGEPCGACRACQRIQKMIHPDLSLVQAEKRGGVLRVDQIRELQHTLALAPYEAHFRVALLLRFEEAHDSAANALLKTLEEPNPQVILILTAESADLLLPTIVSRCELLHLRPLALMRLFQQLEKNCGLPAESARILAHLSGGRPGYALNLYQHPELMEQRKEWLEELLRLFHANRVERFQYVELLLKDKEAAQNALLTWSSFWRDIMLRSAGSSAPLCNLDWETEITELARSFNLSTVRQTLARIERTTGYLSQNINNRLALEVLMLDLPYASE